MDKQLIKSVIVEKTAAKQSAENAATKLGFKSSKTICHMGQRTLNYRERYQHQRGTYMEMTVGSISTNTDIHYVCNDN